MNYGKMRVCTELFSKESDSNQIKVKWKILAYSESTPEESESKWSELWWNVTIHDTLNWFLKNQNQIELNCGGMWEFMMHWIDS